MGLIVVMDVGAMAAGAPLSAVGASVVVAAYSAGAYAPRRLALVSLAVGIAGLLVMSLGAAAVVDRLGAVLVTSCAWWIGRIIGERRRYAAELERAQAELAERVITAERLRLARELHDVVAHNLSIIALHSSVGAHNAAERPQDAVAALEAINAATFQAPAAGWTATAVSYLFQVLLFGALLFNLWEETAWSGFVQARLMTRHGLLRGSLLTAPMFVAVHLPLSFGQGWTWFTVAISVAALAVAAPFFRYLLGALLLDTGGSILAVAIQHAAFNASGNLGIAVGGWQQIAAMILLTLSVAAYRSTRGIRRPALDAVQEDPVRST